MSADRFRELSEQQLNDLPDEEVIAYIRAARAAGRPDAVTLALRIMVFGHYANTERRVRMKVPPEAVDQVTGEAIIKALKASFDGESVGQFVNWLKTITARAISEYFRTGGAKNPGSVYRPDAYPERGGDDDRGVNKEPSVDGGQDEIETQELVDRLLGDLQPKHRRAVELYLFDGWPAGQAGQLVGDELGEALSEANVHQIASRFRGDLRDALGGAA